MRLREKGGKRHAMPCHHNLEEYLIAHLDGAGLRWRFQVAAVPHDRSRHLQAHAHGTAASERLCDDSPARGGGQHQDEAWQSQFPGNRDHGLSQERRHPRKGRGNGNHASTGTTQLYDRRRDEVSLGEVERIVI
jgi:integrase/recombinase XerC